MFDFYRHLQDKRNTTLQLAEVQAKLLSMKNKLWTGGHGEIGAPLSLGSTSAYNLPYNASSQTKLV